MPTQKSVSKKREGADGWVAAQQRQAGRRGLGSRLPGGGGRGRKRTGIFCLICHGRVKISFLGQF